MTDTRGVEDSIVQYRCAGCAVRFVDDESSHGLEVQGNDRHSTRDYPAVPGGEFRSTTKVSTPKWLVK